MSCFKFFICTSKENELKIETNANAVANAINVFTENVLTAEEKFKQDFPQPIEIFSDNEKKNLRKSTKACVTKGRRNALKLAKELVEKKEILAKEAELAVIEAIVESEEVVKQAALEFESAVSEEVKDIVDSEILSCVNHASRNVKA